MEPIHIYDKDDIQWNNKNRVNIFLVFIKLVVGVGSSAVLFNNPRKELLSWLGPCSFAGVDHVVFLQIFLFKGLLKLISFGTSTFCSIHGMSLIY
jgi:hypothetical protein